MYICPVCNRKFDEENKIQKHFLSCWKENNSSHKSKDAPRSKDIITRQVDENIINFFNSFE